MTTAYNMVELESTVELCDNSFDRENQIFDHRLSVLHRNVFGKHSARLMLSAKITCRGLRVEHGGFHLFRRFVGHVWMAITRDSDPVVELFVCFSASFTEVPWCWPEIWWSSLDISVIRRICETKWKKGEPVVVVWTISLIAVMHGVRVLILCWILDLRTHAINDSMFRDCCKCNPRIIF